MFCIGFNVNDEQRLLTKFEVEFGSISMNETNYMGGLLYSVKSFEAPICESHLKEANLKLKYSTCKCGFCSILGCSNPAKVHSIDATGLDLIEREMQYGLRGISSLGDKFLKDMEISESDVVFKAIVLELLNLVVKDYKLDISDEDLNNLVFSDDVKSQTHIIDLMHIAGFWSNDLIDIAIEYVKEHEVCCKLSSKNDSEIWRMIHNWVLNNIIQLI